MLSTQEGRIYPLGPSWSPTGTNFSVYSERAERVELCLFDSPQATEESERIPLWGPRFNFWTVDVAGLEPGQIYGYRVDGPYDVDHGHRFNAHKVLLDPYARAIGREPRWANELFGYDRNSPLRAYTFDAHDSAAVAPLGALIDESFDWQGDARPDIPWRKTVIYECNVKGMTQLHPGVPPNLRGTYEGLSQPALIEHFRSLGVTAVELLPVHAHMDELHLHRLGLRNYWGYNSLSFFAPTTRYAAGSDPGAAVREFKAMVRSLHAAGIEVFLDVVYNHTAEGSENGPTLSLRGMDNAVYYRLNPGNRAEHINWTGTGNTVHANRLPPLRLILDSLRYWVEEMHVDGFRFDLCSVLGRNKQEFDAASPFFQAVLQDPVLRRVKVIAEPWDIGTGGYQVGNFPPGWSEWNGKYRDDIRQYWRIGDGRASKLATRVAGSNDLYWRDSRGPLASVNFVTAHDGFTLEDLVSYDHKHNAANGEQNRDGESHNSSWNGGVEGPTDNAEIMDLRARRKRSMMATLLLSQGVPMISGGDELGRTQGGNNNAYCQDNEISWLHWDLDERGEAFLSFLRRMIAFYVSRPALHRRSFFTGKRMQPRDLADVVWLSPAGRPMQAHDWSAHDAHAVGMWIPSAIADEAADLLVLFNGSRRDAPFHLPHPEAPRRWSVEFDTAEPDGVGSGILRADTSLVRRFSVVVLETRT